MKAGRWWLLVGAGSLVALVLLGAVISASGWLLPLDLAVRRAVLDLRAPIWTGVMQALTAVGAWPFVVGTALTGVVILRRRTCAWFSSLVLAIGVSLSATATALLKTGIGRDRPPASDRLGPAAFDQAFPSGHTGDGSTALWLTAALIALTVPTPAARALTAVSAAALGLGIGLSRIYLGYHWPTDVLGGWLMAGAVTGLAVALVRSHRPRSGKLVARPDHAAVIRENARRQGR